MKQTHEVFGAITVDDIAFASSIVGFNLIRDLKVGGKRRYYNVKFDRGGVAMGKVQRKEIRPCPPPMERWGDFNPGDIVEVFDNNSWKSAKIVEVRDSGKYSVVIHYGSSSMLEVHKSNIRVRQYWNGNGWVLVDKESEKLNEGGLKIPCIGGKVHYQRLQRYGEVRKHDDEHYQISLRGLRKRLDNGAGAGRKFGAVRKGQSWRPVKLASVGPRCCTIYEWMWG
ncbi:uncharacterized protein A4U43_C05F6440 [Asparagus officinalis]|uniref:Agenet domain-containing protein n=1 Tax=Asparagus officinalis TaxID=4686 RepID=A0A5P1EPU3_ASPOF|nr:uncharacterized protein A4U43_C05F6440 [Asparagus officinalis]